MPAGAQEQLAQQPLAPNVAQKLEPLVLDNVAMLSVQRA